MHIHTNPTSDGPTPARCACTVHTVPGPEYPTDHHDAPDCPVFGASRVRRARDIAWLDQHPGAELIRALAATEVGDLADMIRPGGMDRAERRRWQVTVRVARYGGEVHLSRSYWRQGRLVAALIDSATEDAS